MKAIHFGLTIAAAIVAAVPALAQQFPSRPITIVVPNAPGGPNDIVARTIAPKLEARLKQSVVVENKPGGGTYTAGEYVVRANPDGHTLLINAYGGIQPHLFVKGLAHKLAEELVPVAAATESPYLLYGSAATPAKDLKEWVAHAKKNPGKLNVAYFATAANGLEMRGFLKDNGVDVGMIPFSSSTDIITAILRDEIHLYNGTASGPKPQIVAGKIKAFASLGETRDPLMPDVPTAKELGFNWISTVYFAFFAPPKTPANVTKILNEEITAALHAPDVVETLSKRGVAVAPKATLQQLDARLKREYATLVKVAKDAGIEPK